MARASILQWNALPLLVAALAMAACAVTPAEEAKGLARAAAEAANENADAGPLANACTEGRTGYESYAEQLTDSLGATNCTDDGDCRVVVIDNLCNQGCGVAVAARVAATLQQDLDDYASTHCDDCSPSSDTCPPLELLAFCTGGVCSAH
jgi:hypothetical protein